MGRVSVKRLALVLLAPPIIGLIAAVASLLEQPSGRSVCDINSYVSCTQVIFSRYSYFFGVSLSIWAILYFSLAILASLAYLAARRRIAMRIYWGFSIAALPIIGILIYIEVMIIGAICLYCTIMHISIITMGIASTIHIVRAKS